MAMQTNIINDERDLVDDNRLVVISYNLHGFNQGSVGIANIIETLSPDIICVQEHWLSDTNLHKLNDISDNYVAFCSSAMSECLSAGPLVECWAACWAK